MRVRAVDLSARMISGKTHLLAHIRLILLELFVWWSRLVSTGSTSDEGSISDALFDQRLRYPTEFSICNSMRRLSSRAYSIGNSRAIGSTKPRTIIAMASVSSSPRLIR